MRYAAQQGGAPFARQEVPDFWEHLPQGNVRGYGDLRENFDKLLLHKSITRTHGLKLWRQNWDGAGAEPINQLVADRAELALHNMYGSAQNTHADWFDPNVTASPDGEVVFEWWKNDKKLTLYIGPEEATFIKVWGANIAVDMEDGAFDEDAEGMLWSWLNQ